MTEVLEKKPDVVAQLKLDEKPHPEERWEGVFNFFEGPGEPPTKLHAIATLRLGAGLIEGAGIMSLGDRHIVDMTITGTTAGTDMTFDMWLDSSTTAEGRSGDLPSFQGRLACLATLGEDGGALTGTFTHACLSPESCGEDCKGGEGEFDLVRIRG